MAIRLGGVGRIIDFEAFRPVLVAALAYGDGAKGGRPAYDPVAMLKVLVLAAQNCRTVRTRGTSFMMPKGSQEDGSHDQGRTRRSTQAQGVAPR